MYARVAHWENFGADEISRMAEQINSADGPPEGVPARGMIMLADPERGETISIVLFDSEEDLQTGHEAMNAMSPGPDVTGRRRDVRLYEVPVNRFVD